MTKHLPATYWAEAARHAQRMHLNAERYADRLSDRITHPRDPWEPELLRARVRAVRAEAAAWAGYGEQAEQAFADAAEVEMRTPAVPGVYGPRSYDPPTCVHGCCPTAVCTFVNDCHVHTDGAA